MRRRSMVTINVRAWERRQYWHKGVVTDVEVWHAGRLFPRPPRRLPTSTTEVDYCAAHRTRIYLDLACQQCGERPLPNVVVTADDLRATW